MRKFAITVGFLFLMSLASIGYTQQAKGYSTGAYSELGADDTYLDRVSDWIATAGKSRDEKILIKSQRRAQRKAVEIQKNLARKKKEIVKQKQQARQ